MKRVPFRGLSAILFKEFIIVWRDPMTLFFMFFPPLVEMIAFGYALDTDVKHMAMMVLNEDRTVESRQFIDRFVNTETFRVVGEVQSIDAMASEIRKGNAYVGLQIPPHFTRDLRAGFPRERAIAGGRFEFDHRAAGAQHRARCRPDAIARIVVARNRPARRPDRDPAADALQPDHAQPELLHSGRDRNCFAESERPSPRPWRWCARREKGTLEQLLVSPLEPLGTDARASSCRISASA